MTSTKTKRGSLTRTRRTLITALPLAFAALLTAGPADARLETPQDPGGETFEAKVSQTRIAGLYGQKVRGGWVLR